MEAPAGFLVEYLVAEALLKCGLAVEHPGGAACPFPPGQSVLAADAGWQGGNELGRDVLCTGGKSQSKRGKEGEWAVLVAEETA